MIESTYFPKRSGDVVEVVRSGGRDSIQHVDSCAWILSDHEVEKMRLQRHGVLGI